MFCGGHNLYLLLSSSSLMLSNSIFVMECDNKGLQLAILSSLTSAYMQRKRKSRRPGSHSTLSLLRKELREGNLQSLFGGSSCVVPSTSTAPDPLLSSFILPMGDDFKSAQIRSPAETISAKKSSVVTASERYVFCSFSVLWYSSFL